MHTLCTAMTTAVAPKFLDQVGGGELFRFEGYDALQTYGPERVAFQQLRRTFEARGETIATIDTIDLDDIDTCVFIDPDYDYISRFLSHANPPTLVYLMREPPSVVPEHTTAKLVTLSTLFDAVLTWNPSLAELDGFYEYNIPQYLRAEEGSPPPFEDQSLLTNVSSRKYSNHPEELYSEREFVIKYYDEHRPEAFNLYGQYWNQPPRPADIFYQREFPREEYDVYRGLADSKVEVYRDHRFALCFENMTGIDGYLTEKLFDCLRAGAVPVYWGAEDVTDYVPTECFVDYREFGSPVALDAHLRSIDEAEYREYVAAGRKFLACEPDPLTPEQYAETVYDAVSAARGATAGGPDPDPALRRAVLDKGARERFVRQSKDMSAPRYLTELARTARRGHSAGETAATLVRSLWKRYR